MFVSAFDFKVFLSDYGFAFALAAAVLTVVLIIVIAACAVKISALKRQNKILSRQANRAGQLLATADLESAAAVNGKAERNSASEQSAPQTQKPPASAATNASASEPKTVPIAQKEAASAAQKEESTPAARQSSAQKSVPATQKSTTASQKSTSASAAKAPQKSAQKTTPVVNRAAENDERDEEVMDENSRVKYTVKYDRAKMNWIIVKEGNERPTRRVATKSEAMQVARELSKKHDAALSVHKKDGKFQKH